MGWQNFEIRTENEELFIHICIMKFSQTPIFNSFSCFFARKCVISVYHEITLVICDWSDWQITLLEPDESITFDHLSMARAIHSPLLSCPYFHDYALMVLLVAMLVTTITILYGSTIWLFTWLAVMFIALIPYSKTLSQVLHITIWFHLTQLCACRSS